MLLLSFLKVLIISHPAIALVFLVDINDEVLIFHKVSYVFWLLLGPHSNINWEALQPLQDVGDWWLGCSCLRFFIIAVCAQPFKQQSAISINTPESILVTSFAGTGGSPASTSLLWDETGGVMLSVADWSEGEAMSYDTNVADLVL